MLVEGLPDATHIYDETMADRPMYLYRHYDGENRHLYVGCNYCKHRHRQSCPMLPTHNPIALAQPFARSYRDGRWW